MKKAYLEMSIGGYQGLDLPLFPANLAPSLVKTNSARSALKVVLKAVSAQKVWLPTYTCDAVVEAVKDLGIKLEYYRVSPTFNVDSPLSLRKGEYILVVDYFGMSRDSVNQSLCRFGQANTIVDCSQAFFSDYKDALATLWSPRKFFGLPDGGLLYSNDPRISQPEVRDTTSATRMAHLISRLSNSPETAYQQYQEAEQAISKLPLQGMSHLTERLLQSVDYQSARETRTRNAQYLHERLGQYNRLNLKIDETVAPMCYPFLPSVKAASKADLIKERVFVPTYWPEVLGRVEQGCFEWDLVTNGLFLPCDQRNVEEDMDRLISLLAIK